MSFSSARITHHIGEELLGTADFSVVVVPKELLYVGRTLKANRHWPARILQVRGDLASCTSKFEGLSKCCGLWTAQIHWQQAKAKKLWS